MEVAELEKSFKSNIEPCYVLSGNAPYYIDKAMNIFNGLIDQAMKDFNYNEFSGVNCLDEVLFALRTIPVMSQYRLVVWNIDTPNAAQVKTFNQKIKEYLSSAEESAVLVIRDADNKLSAIYKYATIVSCKDVVGFDAKKEASAIMSDIGMQGDSWAVNELLLRCNGNFSIFANELIKIKQYSGNNFLDMQLIETCVPRSAQYSVYKISDNVVAGNKNKVFEIVKDLMDRQQAPLNILSALTKFFRQCFYYKISNLSKEEFISKFAIKDFVYQKLANIVVGYKPRELNILLEELEGLEYKIKSGVLTPNDAINMATIKLTQKNL